MKYVICSQDRRSSKTVEFYTTNISWDWDIDKACRFDTQKEAFQFMATNWPLFPANDSNSIYYVEAVR